MNNAESFNSTPPASRRSFLTSAAGLSAGAVLGQRSPPDGDTKFTNSWGQRPYSGRNHRMWRSWHPSPYGGHLPVCQRDQPGDHRGV